MSTLTANLLRKSYLDFFSQKISEKHHVIPSSSLVPENDPTTLFTSSGMQPLVPYLLGEHHPVGNLLVDSQKCFRSQDIEEVGDNRHTTFFEMLGNWSLGEYFKKEQLRWFFTFMTQEVGLDPRKIFVTVFSGNGKLGIPRDTESVQIWQDVFSELGIEAKVVEDAETRGIQSGRIFYYSEKKNWWSRSGTPEKMPAGEPGGPDSEMFYDFGVELRLHETSVFKDQPCHVNCDCGRFMEIGNSVFMQYQKQASGAFKELDQRNVDFGGGLERMLAAANNDKDVFKTDLFWPIILEIEKASGRSYTEETVQRATRIICDHVKAATFLAADGVYPSNKAQGYFSRRLLRRAIRYADIIGIQSQCIEKLVDVVSDIYHEAYPNITQKKKTIQEVFRLEEEKFRKSLSKGLKEISKFDVLDGHVAFQMYETYGFPLELTQEIAEEKGQVIDKDQFQTEFNKHKEESRTASSGMFKGGLSDHSEITTQYHTVTHLLHAALRKILGTHVQQKGSNITAERLRFDFSHPTAITEEEKIHLEKQINDWITSKLPVTVQTMKKSDALKSGAVAFFIEKYPNDVTVYTVGKNPDNGWVSKELCGGPHVHNTSEIGQVKIMKEQSASAGVRRIYIELA